MSIRRRASAVLVLCAATSLGVSVLAVPSQANERPERRTASPEPAVNSVFVLDGLRPDSITEAETPNLFRLQE